MAAPTNATTSSTNSAEIKILYSKDFLEALEDELQYHSIAQKTSVQSVINPGAGKTIEYTRFLKLPVITSALDEADPGDCGNDQ